MSHIPVALVVQDGEQPRPLEYFLRDVAGHHLDHRRLYVLELRELIGRNARGEFGLCRPYVIEHHIALDCEVDVLRQRVSRLGKDSKGIQRLFPLRPQPSHPCRTRVPAVAGLNLSGDLYLLWSVVQAAGCTDRPLGKSGAASEQMTQRISDRKYVGSQAVSMIITKA
jgi:hypothetical protein